jgi:hypothetical protein
VENYIPQALEFIRSVRIRIFFEHRVIVGFAVGIWDASVLYDIDIK